MSCGPTTELENEQVAVDEPAQGVSLATAGDAAYVGYSDGTLRKHRLAPTDLVRERRTDRGRLGGRSEHAAEGDVVGAGFDRPARELRVVVARGAQDPIP